MKHKRTVALITAIVLLISSIGIYGSTLLEGKKGEVSTMISFNFDGIDQGLDPYGETFNIQQFKNEEVLQNTIDLLNLGKKGIDVTTLGKKISLKGHVPDDVLDRILPQSSSTTNTQTTHVSGTTYHPTQYTVTLQLDKSFKLSKRQGVEVLNTLVENYKEYFMARYKDTDTLKSAVTTIDTERYDYSEYISLAEGQLNVIYEYLSAKEQACKDFKSESGTSFGELLSEVELLRDVDVANAKSLIDTFAITKDQNRLNSIYANRITKLKRELSQVVQEKAAVANALRDYEKDPTVVLDNGTIVDLSKDDKEKEEREVSLYEELVEKNIGLQKKSNTLAYQLKYYEELYNKLLNNGTSETLRQKYLQEVEETSKYLEQRIQSLVEEATALLDEYFEKEVFANSITVVKGVSYRSNFRIELIKNTFIICVATSFGLLLAIIYVLIKESRVDKKQLSA